MDINGKDTDKKLQGGNKLVPFNDALNASGAKLLNVLPVGLEQSDKKDMAKAMIYLTLKAYSEVKELRSCTPDSIINSLMDCATLGMMPFSKMNECCIIAYGGKASMQLEYRGILKLCRNTGEYKDIRVGVVREGDKLDYYKGLTQDLRHFDNGTPTHNRAVTHVYALYVLMNGGSDFEVMTIEDVKAHRDKYSKQYKSAKKYKKESDAIWIKEEVGMSIKTVLIKLMKYAPKSDKLIQQFALDRDLKREIAPEKKDFTDEKEAEFIKQRNADATGVYETTDEEVEPKKESKKKTEKKTDKSTDKSTDKDLVDQKDLASYFAELNKHDLTDEDKDNIDKGVKEKYKVKSKKELTKKQLNEALQIILERIKTKDGNKIADDFDKAEKEGKA